MKNTTVKILSCSATLAIGMMSVIATAAFASPYYENKLSTKYNEELTFEKNFSTGGADYGLCSYYNTGSNINPFDNAPIAVKAGATTFKDRHVYAKIKEYPNGETKTAENNGVYAGSHNNVNFIEANAWMYTAYGTGYGEAEVYDGRTQNGSELVGRLIINVTG